MHDFKTDIRFKDIEPFKSKVWLSSPTMHGDEIRYIEEAYYTNWMSTVGENINQLEANVGKYMSKGNQRKYAVALVNGTAAIHLAVKMAAEKVYHSSTGISTPSGKGVGGALFGKRVFCTDMTFDASVNPILYEGGEPVFIDSEYETWNMDPLALRRAFEIYPDVKIVIFVHLYGMPGKIEEVKKICEEYGAVLIEDAAEALGASITLSNGTVINSGSVGDFGIISYNGNKIITGSSGGALIVPDEYSYNKTKKWSTQSREAASWYEHEELGYNYRISNIIAGVIRGQWEHLSDHIGGKRRVYARYAEGLKDLPVEVHGGGNYWLTSLLIDKEAMCATARDSRHAVYETEKGKSCPTEILDALSSFNAEGRPIWKPMHLQPMYRSNDFITVNGISRGNSDAYIDHGDHMAVTEDIFNRGLCLPSDNKMDGASQDMVIKIIRKCFL